MYECASRCDHSVALAPFFCEVNLKERPSAGAAAAEEMKSSRIPQPSLGSSLSLAHDSHDNNFHSIKPDIVIHFGRYCFIGCYCCLRWFVCLLLKSISTYVCMYLACFDGSHAKQKFTLPGSVAFPKKSCCCARETIETRNGNCSFLLFQLRLR